MVEGSAWCLDPLSATPNPRLVGEQVARVHMGEQVVCGVTSDGAGACADGTVSARAVRVVDSVRSIASVDYSGIWCASRERGGVRCGRVQSMIDSALPPARPTGLPDTVRYAEALGGYVSCARAERGDVWCWGNSSVGELGRGEAHDSAAARVAGGHRFRSLAAGANAFCAVDVNGGVWCWGSGRWGVMGDTTTLDRCTMEDASVSCAKTPRRVPLPAAARQVDLSTTGACALLVDGRVACWGSTSRRPVSLVTGLPGDVLEIAVGGHACARTRSGELWCWSQARRVASALAFDAP